MLWKYLLIAPILTSMLLYISCSDALENPVSVKTAGKMKTTFYNAEGKPVLGENILTEYREKNFRTEEITENGETYFDYYYDQAHPTFGSKVTLKELSGQEREEYNSFIADQDTNTFDFWARVDIYRLENGRKMITVASDYYKDEEISDHKKEVIFSKIDRIPSFPGCEENDRKCFNQKMHLHFVDNFDRDIPKQVDLPTGMKKIIMKFKIDKNGGIKDIDVQAPHDKLKTEAIRIIGELPVMTPGKHNGKEVDVAYTLPMSIYVNPTE